MTPASTAQPPPGSTSKPLATSADTTITTPSGNHTGSAATVRDPLLVTIPRLRQQIFKDRNIPDRNTSICSPEDSEQTAWVHVLQYAQNNPAYELCCARWGILTDLRRALWRRNLEQSWECYASRPIKQSKDPAIQVERRDYLEFLFRNARLTPYQTEICQAKSQGIASSRIAQRRGVTKQAVNQAWQTILCKFRNIIKTHNLPEII